MPGLLRAAPALPLKRRGHGAEQALALLTQPLTKDLPERHIASLRHLCAELKHGCTLDSLPTVSKVLGVVIDNVRAEPAGPFLEVAYELLRVLSRPFVRLHSSDDLAVGGKISELFQVVQQCLEGGMSAVLSCSAAALFEEFVDNSQSRAGCITPSSDSAPSCLNQQAHVRLLAENQIGSAVVQALKHAAQQTSQETQSSALPDDFSIAAVQLHTSNTPAGNRRIANPSNSDLISALLRAAVAFSTSNQLSQQLLASGVMSPIALLLNQGGFRDQHTSLVVELLWNLLEACPLSDSHTNDHIAAENSALCARHSQILKPRQNTSDETSLSGAEQDADYDNDAEQLSALGPDDTPQADVDAQPEDAQADREDENVTEEDPSQEPQQAFDEGIPGGYSSNGAADGAADTDTPLDAPATAGDGASGNDAEAAAISDDEGVMTDAEAGLSGAGNPRAAVNPKSRTSPPSAVDADDSAVDDRSAEEVQQSDVSRSATVAPTDTGGTGFQEEVAEGAAGIVRVLTDCLEHGYSAADKELRNNVLVVAGMLAESRPSRSALCCPELLQQLVIASTEPELGESSTAYFRGSSQSIGGEDFELRQLAWTTLARLMLHDPEAVNSESYSFVRSRIFLTNQLVTKVLLFYIQPDDGYGDWPLHWTFPQLSMLRQVALCTLHSMAPSFPEVYEACGGPAQVLQFLVGCSDGKLLATGLHHMHHACTASALLCTTWAGQGSMELALSVAANSTWPVHVRRTALLLVSVLCRGSAEAADQFQQLEGVASLCVELEKLKLMGNEPATLYDFAVLDAVWSGIVQSPEAMQRFLLADGLGSLLDLLDRGAAALQPLLLTVIADVLGTESGEQVQATDIFYEWVCSKHNSASHMILEHWRQEEAGRGVASPYCTASQHHSACLSHELISAAVGTATASTSSDTVYIKIHAIFSQLGFAEAAARVDLPDQATLCAVEQYFALQQGIVWQNIADKFAAEGLDPIEEDRVRIREGIEQAADIRQSVQEKQQALMQEHADQLMQAELEFVRAKRAQDERDAEACHYHKDMSTLSVKERLAAKAKREQMLLDSFVKEEERPVFDDELALEAFNLRRPSHAAHAAHASHVAQQAILERLSESQSPVAQAAADLIIKQLPDQKMETKPQKMEVKAPLFRGVSIHFTGTRQLSEVAGLTGLTNLEYEQYDEFNEADYEELGERDSGSDDMNDSDDDDDEEGGFDSD